MTAFFTALYFILGLAVGSFLNVVILRHQTGLGLRGRSFCFSCGHQLFWRDLVPLVSFALQKGRCNYCGARISSQYPLVEFISGALFALIFLKLDFSFSPHHIFNAAYYALIFSILLAIAFYDIRHKIIPNILVYSFVAFSFLSVFVINNSLPTIHDLFSGPVLALPFVLLWLFSKGRWIGLGDAKLALGIGWLLGPSSAVAAVILAFWIGAVFGLALLALSANKKHISHLFPRFKRFTIKSEIPFAPFLISGTVFAFFCDISFADIQSLFLF